jgi:hypothetical protein
MKKYKRTLWDEIRYYCFYSWYNWLSDRPLAIKSFFQRGKRGWADKDTWDFDYYLCEVISGGLKHLKELNHSSEPPLEIYDKIIAGFDCAKLLMDEPGLDQKDRLYAETIRNEGFDLFKKYFNYFWD